MENTMFIALSRQMSLRREMTVVANNIANMNTNGFKGEKVMFVEHLVRSKGSGSVLGDKLNYVRDIATMRDTSRGHIEQTSNPLDVALAGDGYFAIGDPIGEKYTRNGRFQLDATGQLVTQHGDPVLSNSDQPFFFGPTDTKITIAGDGTVASENGSLGRLKIVNFKNELDLKQAGNSAFRPGPDNFPEEIEYPELIQGALETSNVEPIIELTKMIEVHRAYNGAKTFIDKEDERQKTMIREMTKQA